MGIVMVLFHYVYVTLQLQDIYIVNIITTTGKSPE